MSKIEFKDVTFSYSQSGKNTIVNNMSCSFDSNMLTIVTGKSGCGKSTVLYLAAGIYPQYSGVLHSGTVLIDGKESSTLSPEKRCSIVGMMFQNPDLQFCMDTVENEILFCLGNIGIPREKMKEIINYALNFCDIAHLRNRRLQSLSGGEKQKAMLSCLIALNPQWLLLDEPFANVDEKSAKELVQKIHKLHKKGVGILVVDHRLDYWLQIADEIRLMNRENGIVQTNYILEDISAKIMIEAENTKDVQEYETILQLNDLTVSRNENTILNKVNFEFERNKIYFIIGESGSGKSTLFGTISGLYKYEGDILLKGKNIKKRKNYKAGMIGFVTQSPQDQFVSNTVLEEIELGLKIRSSNKDVQKEAESILREIDLWKYRNFSPYMLSQGQQRRLGVASLLAYDCEILICDEPTYAQDSDNTVSIMNALINKAKERGMTLIISTHDLKLAKYYAEVIIELKEGKLYEYSKSSI